MLVVISLGAIWLISGCGSGDQPDPTVAPTPTRIVIAVTAAVVEEEPTSVGTVTSAPTMSPECLQTGNGFEFDNTMMPGSWLICGTDVQIRFTARGLFSVGPNVPEPIFDDLVINRGNWEFQEGVLTIRSEESPCPSEPEDFALVAIDESLIVLDAVSEPCDPNSLSHLMLQRIP